MEKSGQQPLEKTMDGFFNRVLVTPEYEARHAAALSVSAVGKKCVLLGKSTAATPVYALNTCFL